MENTVESPLITVITVVLNAKKNLEKTIQSVAEQEYKRIEYIVIDGGSTDGSVDIIRQFHPSLISAWISEKDKGIYSAMNKGAGMASGEWICFLNAGDVFVNSSIIGKIAESILQQQEKPDIIYGNILVRKPKGKFKERIALSPRNYHRMYFCHQSAFVKLDLLRQYPFDEHYKLSSDLKFLKNCFFNNKKFLKLNFPVVIYDVFGLSNTDRELGLRENISVINEMDKGWKKYKFLLRLYFIIYWRKIFAKHKSQSR